MKKEIKTESAEAFKNKDGEYVFPFKVLDPTYGRIEWCIEPVRGKKKKGRYYIEKLLVQARQTKDKRYEAKLFEIPCFTESITGSMFDKGSYLHHVWLMKICEDHNAPLMRAYPKDEHTQLVIPINSSISVEPKFI